MLSSTIQSEALAYLGDLYAKYKEGTCWVTKNKAVNMRYLWDVVRENYFGVFSKTKDRFGQDNIFYPLTESMLWENVKNIDVDTKDINTRALHPNGLEQVVPCRYIIKDWMYKNNFGEILNKWLMYFALDGHLIVKTIKGKDSVVPKYIDQRNCFYDFHCDDIHDTPFMERSIQNVNDIKDNFKSQGWINLNRITGRTNLPKLDDETKENDVGAPEAELFEYWGGIRKSWVTGQLKDKDTWVDGRMYASNLNDNGQMHFIEATDERSPYEDVSFEDAPNRHPGRGVGEKLIFLQIYLNTLYNVRRMNNLVMMNQLFKFKTGAGITTENIANLVAGGAIGLRDMNDFERIDTRNLNFGDSLNEETNLIQVANRVTSTQEAASGEKLPSSTPATNAIIQNQAVKSSQQLRQERFGLFLSRLFRNQLLPALVEMYKKKGVLRLDNDKKLPEVKRNIASYYAVQGYKDSQEMGVEANPQEMYNNMRDDLDNREEIFMKLERVDPTNIDIEFFVTDESFDKNTVLQNLQLVLAKYPNSQKVLREIYDILGLDADSLVEEQSQAIPQPAPQPQEGATQPSQLLGQQTNRVMAQTARV